jgi:hypothetical protein
MAWTAPQTWAANAVLTAADLNIHLRDNMLETMPAKAVTEGSIFVTSGANSIVERQIVTARVTTSQSTSSTSYTNLATVGPTVSVTTGTGAIIFHSCSVQNNGSGFSSMSWDISGATTRAALDADAIRHDGVAASNPWKLGVTDIVTAVLTPGVNTFTAKYKAESGSTATFADRFICVIPF